MDFPGARRGQNSREQRRSQQEIYVGNLPSNISMRHLKNLFSKYKPKRIQKVENERKCYAFINFEDSETLELAVKQLNDTMYEGRRLVVCRAHPKGKEAISRKNTGCKQSEDISDDSEERSDIISLTKKERSMDSRPECALLHPSPAREPGLLDFIPSLKAVGERESELCSALERRSLCGNSEYLSCEEDEQEICTTCEQSAYRKHEQGERRTHKQNKSVCMRAILRQQSRNLELEEKKLLLEMKKLQLEIEKLTKENCVCKCV